MSNILKAYELAREQYAAIGVNTDEALAKLDTIPVSMHCWQGDDVGGFENTGGELTGGIMSTGNYPGKARNAEELRADIDVALSLIPGPKKVNIHAFYLESDVKVDRDAIEPKHFDNWANWAKAKGIGLDFNPTFFSHPLSDNGTLSAADEGVRKFWIEHGKRTRVIAEYLGRKTGFRAANNFWMPDGCKERPMDSYGPRARMKDALDEIFSVPVDPAFTKDAVESKLFGIGSEAYVVGSHEFFMGYAMANPNVMLTLDTGHFHPTEVVSSKYSALLCYLSEILLHVSRPIRWDSDHVVAFDDELTALMSEIVRADALDRTNIALDYFDGSINRIAAWVIGTRNTKKALLKALLEPVAALQASELKGDATARLALTEEYKTYPLGAVWDYYCETKDMPARDCWLENVRKYENDVTSKR
ncbi:MAG: L-rhamnose isomerase [Clostridiales bacterium]|nr:L-rhamnose isomerase [Clostridiales bacterium]